MDGEVLATEPESDVSEEAFGVTIRSRLYHADLLAAAKKMGSVKALAEHLGVNISTLWTWMSLKVFPTLVIERKNGSRRPHTSLIRRWPEISRKLYELTGKTTEQLFPNFVRLSGFLDLPKTREETREIPAGMMLGVAHAESRALPLSERVEQMDDLKADVAKALEGLNYRLREVIRLRFGLDGGEPRTLEEIGKAMGITRERVRQLNIRAIEELRERVRFKGLEEYIA